MAEGRERHEVYWVDPRQRGILPVDQFRVPRRLRRTVRKNPFEIRCDTAFGAVLEGCAAPTPERPDTWINEEILRLNLKLFEMGFAHSVECWHDDRLVGGLYGIAIGGAFFGESMFSRARDASKASLLHPARRLKLGGLRSPDTQVLIDHLD